MALEPVRHFACLRKAFASGWTVYEIAECRDQCTGELFRFSVSPARTFSTWDEAQWWSLIVAGDVRKRYFSPAEKGPGKGGGKNGCTIGQAARLSVRTGN